MDIKVVEGIAKDPKSYLFKFCNSLYVLACFVFLTPFPIFSTQPQLQQGEEKRDLLEKEGQEIQEKSRQLFSLYDLPLGLTMREITTDVLANPTTTESQRENILAHDRRIFLFRYPSDGVYVKGFISLTPNNQNQPLLILLRGGNKKFGLLNPAIDLASYKDYTTISTTYRGGVSEGEDEFGGKDVKDVKNLIDYIPYLEQTLQVCFQPKQTFLLGASRGGMQMFLTLARYPEIQRKINKIVSLSGMLDVQHQIEERPDMKELFVNEFGLKIGENEETWIKQRNPILAVPLIRKDLPILILQGDKDLRVSPAQGYHMVERLQENGNQVTYSEVPGGDHTLYNFPDRMDFIVGWLESE